MSTDGLGSSDMGCEGLHSSYGYLIAPTFPCCSVWWTICNKADRRGAASNPEISEKRTNRITHLPASFVFCNHLRALTRHSIQVQRLPPDPFRRPCATTPKCNINALTSVTLSKPGAPNTNKRMYGVRRTSQQCNYSPHPQTQYASLTFSTENTDSTKNAVRGFIIHCLSHHHC